MANETTYKPVKRIEDMIFLVRGQRVMLDYDLAKVYGVSTKRLKEQFRRNVEKFPKDFAFALGNQELANLRSQIAASSSHGGLRYPPIAFTEHGTLMLATVLNSRVAVEASVRVVRTFVLMRGQLAAHKQLTHKLAELEVRVSGNDSQITHLFEAIRQLIEPPPAKRTEIGFHIRETAPPYRVNSRPRI